MKFIQSPKVPAPAGHYSQAVEAAGLVFVSGVLPGKPPEGVKDSFERQVRASCAQCTNILNAAGCELSDVVQCTAYLVGVDRWPEFNAIYAEIMGDHKPARAVVPVPELHYGFLIEVQLIAEKKSNR
jgi:reactive intermediate/imine deaminase